MSGPGVPRYEMPGFPRRLIRRSLARSAAEELLAGRGAAPGAPASQHALARLLEAAAGPSADWELADEAAYVATFVLATSPVGARRAMLPQAFRVLAQLTLAVVAATTAVGATAAYTGQLPARLQELAHIALAAPAPHDGRSLPPGARLSPGRAGYPSSVRAGLPIRETPPPAWLTAPRNPQPPPLPHQSRPASVRGSNPVPPRSAGAGPARTPGHAPRPFGTS